MSMLVWIDTRGPYRGNTRRAQGKHMEHLGKTQGTYRENTVNIQGKHREHTGKTQGLRNTRTGPLKSLFRLIATYKLNWFKCQGYRSKIKATCRWKRPHYVIEVEKMKSKIGALQSNRRFYRKLC